MSQLGAALIGLAAICGCVAILMLFINFWIVRFLELEHYSGKEFAALMMTGGLIGVFFPKARDPERQAAMNRRVKIFGVALLLAIIFGGLGFIFTYVQPSGT